MPNLCLFGAQCHALGTRRQGRRRDIVSASDTAARYSWGTFSRLTPSADSVTPSDDSVTPSTDSVTPSADSVTPSADSVTPSADVT